MSRYICFTNLKHLIFKNGGSTHQFKVVVLFFYMEMSYLFFWNETWCMYVSLYGARGFG
jgi:hypothetical protein